MPSTILVAGGAGFVGSSLALRLRDRYPDARIVAADSLKRRGSEWNLPRLAAARVEFVHADIRRPDDLAFPGLRFDLLVDCSAEPAVLAAYEGGPAGVIDTNLVGTVNLLEVARRHGADVVFLSTSRVYPVAALESIAFEETATRFAIAPHQTLPGVSPAGVGEAFPLDGARSLYGATKLACELLLAEYADMYGLRYVVDRCGVITGPWQMGKVDQGVFALWMGRHYFRKELAYIGYGGTGKQVRDFVAIDELGDLVLHQIGALAALPARVYNVGGGAASSLSLLETTALCEEITGHRVDIARVAENRPSDVRIYVTDNARVTADTGWRPVKSPRDTLVAIFDWIRANERLVAPLWS
jgi:CDP-paratose 2-epimerase